MAHFTADVRFALRGFRKRPVQSLLVVLTLAVGLAANAVIFSGLDALLLRPLEFPHLPRLVRVWETSPGSPSYYRNNVAPANFHDFQASGMFETLVAMSFWDSSLRGREMPELVHGFRVSPDFFDALGVVPVLGRGFEPHEGREGQHRQVVLGHELWRRSFASDPGIVGQSVMVDGEAYTVVGVAPKRFAFMMGAELWAPLVLPPPGTASREAHYLTVFGLLAPGRTLEEARAAVAVVAQRLQTEFPATNAARGIQMLGMQRGFEDFGLRPIFGLWQLAAALVLLIACVNVANLMLARGAERQRELAVRLALGARRGRVVRQLLTEGLVLAVSGIFVALPLAALGVREMRIHMPAEILRFVPAWDLMALDARVLVFTAFLGLATTLFFAAVPALRASRPALSEALKEGGRSATVGAARQRGRNALVVAQVTFALTLLVVAGLALKSVQSLVTGPQGFDTTRLLTLSVRLPDTRYKEPAARRAFSQRVAERLSTLPGATRVAYANVLPGNDGSSDPVQVEGEAAVDKSDPPMAGSRMVSPAYFDTMRIPLLAGRGLTAQDDENAMNVAVVSRAFADRFFPGRDALGRRFRAGAEDQPWLTVVGVSGDVIHDWFTSRNEPTYYRPYAQEPRRSVAYAVRTTGDPVALIQDARRAVGAADPDLPAYDVRSMERAIAINTIGLRYVAAVMSVFGVLAVILAVSGIYGVMSYRVSQRTQEIGVRMALGASRRDVLRLAMGQAVLLTVVGLVLGGGLGWAVARALSGALQGAIPFDAAIFALFTVALGTAALVAAYLPARRALTLDPVLALRAE
jgi:putative ABC transport system permease protein